MSSIALTPLREIVAHALHVCDHHAFLTSDHLAKLARAQAPRCRPYQARVERCSGSIAFGDDKRTLGYGSLFPCIPTRRQRSESRRGKPRTDSIRNASEL